VRVTLGEAGHLPNLRVEVAMRAQSADGPFAHEVAALSGGDGHELLSLPKNLAAALLVYDDRRAREEGASQRLDALSKVLGGRIDRWDHGKIESAFSGWARGRGDWLTVGMLTDGGRRTGVWRTAVSDRAALQQAVVSILHLVEVPAISAPLADWVGELTLSPPTAGAASTESVHIVRRPPKLRRRPGEAGVNANVFDAVWSVGDATAAGAIGDDARAQLESLTRGGGRTLREQTRLVAALARRAGGTSLCAFVDLGRLGLWHGESPSIVLTYGRPRVDGRDEASLTIDIPPALLLDYTSTLASLLHP
jgi:hypothetical protein